MRIVLAAPVVTATVAPSSGSAAGGNTFAVVGADLTGATVASGADAATLTSGTGAAITGTVPGGTAVTTVPAVVTTAAAPCDAAAFLERLGRPGRRRIPAGFHR